MKASRAFAAVLATVINITFGREIVRTRGFVGAWKRQQATGSIQVRRLRRQYLDGGPDRRSSFLVR